MQRNLVFRPFNTSLARATQHVAWSGALLAALGCSDGPGANGNGSAATGSPNGSSGEGGTLEGSAGSSSSSSSAGGEGSGGSGSVQVGTVTVPVPTVTDDEASEFLQASTVSLRVDLPVAAQGQILAAEVLATQLEGYDPGSLIRCELGNQESYDATIDTIGGVRWGYGISTLEDQSQPRLYAGLQEEVLFAPSAQTGAANADAAAVEIVKPDIVAVTEAAALFYSEIHGLLMVDLTGDAPAFQCATQLPGNVDQFFFHQGHLVGMTKAHGQGSSHLLHFTVSGTTIDFTEDVDLGAVNILDSRRFNDKLVFYTDYKLPAAEEATPSTQEPADPPQGGVASGVAAPDIDIWYEPQAQHRALRVYQLGDNLVEEMYDTLIDTTPSQEELFASPVDQETPAGTVINESRRFGTNMWASDKYFVVTEGVSTTTLQGWETRSWSVCTQSHFVETTYDHCWTEYETRPNPDYVEPDNSGGDRSCQGVTLSDCLVSVARVSNKTIQVPIGKKCEERVRTRFVCDATETRSADYPVFDTQYTTGLFIYEYTDDGFVQVDTSVHEITTDGLESESPDAQIDVLNTSPDAVDLAVPGNVQTLYFQNGYLYVISQGVLQVYAMGGSSIIRTSSLQVVNENLQSTLFTDDQLILSDFGWRGGDHSTLRVISLANPAFPTAEAATSQLPGGHRSILLSQYGIFTIGTVQQFMGQAINALKLGLFSDPYVEETAYLILGTDLQDTWLGLEEAQLFNGAQQRLLLPYYGRTEDQKYVHRVGISRIESDEIVSEGAVELPEAAQRVRLAPTESESYLTFAANSIEWLTPDAQEWKTDPVLEYLTPFAVYRLNEESDYVEVQRLANRCRLYFANAADINQRDNGLYSEEFTCEGWPVAFDRRLLFGNVGIEFDVDGSFVELSEEQVAETRAAIAARPICLLSLDLVPNVWVNPNDLPEDPEVTCVTPEQYEQLRQMANNGDPVVAPEPEPEPQEPEPQEP